MRKQTVNSAAAHLRRAAATLRKVADQVDVAIHILTTPEPVEHKTQAGYKIKLHTLQERHTRDAISALGRMPQRLLKKSDLWATVNDPQIPEKQKEPVVHALLEIILSNEIPVTPLECWTLKEMIPNELTLSEFAAMLDVDYVATRKLLDF